MHANKLYESRRQQYLVVGPPPLVRVAARRRVRHLDGIREREVAQVADVDGAAVAAPEEAAEAKGVLESRRAPRAKGAEPRRRLRERGEDEHAGERLALDGGDLAVGEGEEDTEGCLLYTSPSPRDRG